MITIPCVRTAQRLTVTGVVQGVGFRPFIHRLAVRHGLAGTVTNVGGEVEILVEGTCEDLHAFRAAVCQKAPALARVESLDVTHLPVSGRTEFVVERSRDPPGRRQPVSPDAAPCAACTGELFAPANRRFRYPFITCTECGPRFTVIEAMPYDRERTSMRLFPMCPACQHEYDDPSDRRYHSETNSCPRCGPQLWFEHAAGGVLRGSADDAISAAAQLLRTGGIVALRGLGGFHLAVDATSAGAVEQLRERKGREAKPFAVMVRTVEDAAMLGAVGPEEAALLEASSRPVVLLRRHPGATLAASVAPGLDTVGVLLPSTPVHHLLLAAVDRPLVMTSGNASAEPIAIGNAEARARLNAIADGFLCHDREIVSRYDDTVIRVVAHAPIVLRRARGYAPLPLRLPVPSPVPLLAVGADLKSTFTLVDGGRAYLSQHLGDLEEFATLEHFQDTLRRYRGLFQIEPEVVVRDLHPGYHSTAVAERFAASRTIIVQHHHAHIAAVLAEHGQQGPAIGVAYDGTGLGDDGKIWGAEILLADLVGYRRLVQLRYAALPGGDLAARQGWRAALGYRALAPDTAASFALAVEAVPTRERELAEVQIARGINAPFASSMGRLFDAASAVLGLRGVSVFEGQAAMELEALAGSRVGAELPFPLCPGADGVWQLDPIPLLAALGEARLRGDDPAQLAADFHASVISTTTDAVIAACEVAGVSLVVLSGGVFQNARLATLLPERLKRRGLTVLLPREAPPNDGAISYGQAAIAAAQLACEVRSFHGGA